MGSLALQFVATAALLFVLWLVVGGSIAILIAYVAINLIGVVIRALNTTTGDRADKAAIPEIVRRARRRNPGP